MKINRSIAEPIRKGLNWTQRWTDFDQGLIASWERGREKCLEDSESATQARSGQLIVLPWKGGVEKMLKGKKYGTLSYLAMWQGLRGDDLDIDTDTELTIVCTASNMPVIFTSDQSKYAEP